MASTKFLILLFYYNRPKLAQAALESTLMQEYDNYEVVFIDDSEDPKPGNALYYETVGDGTDHIWYVHTADTKEQKIARGGSMFGEFANQAMLQSNADVALMLCDDDKLTPWYLKQLDLFYRAHPQVLYSYCDVITHDALVDDWKEKLKEPASDHFLNANHNPHCMMNSKDSSQGSWRLQCIKEGGIRFRAPWTVALDAYLYQDLYARYGNGVYNGITGQVKSYSECQLGRHGGYDRVD